MSAALPLIAAADLDAPIAWRDGRPISRRRYLVDVDTLARRLPQRGAALSLTADRYRFAVGFGAAMQRGQTSLMPPNHTAETTRRLREAFADLYTLVDPERPPPDLHGLPGIAFDADPAPSGAAATVPLIDAAQIVAQVLTSGSTGASVPHAKPWALLVVNAQAESARLAESMGRSSLAGVTLVATVPPQHMYGFESTILVAMLGGAAFDTERPFYAADIVAALERAPRPRMLVTTPFHLKVLLDANIALPSVDLVLCATAPLSPQLAARAEAALGAPLVEIYGCTEAGQVATRRTTRGAEWHTFAGVHLDGDGDRTMVAGGHVPQPTLLADVFEVIDPQHFRLLGRSNDLVNIAGKRNSLGHLNYHLNAIDGVADGAFWMPPERDDGEIARLVAFVVAPRLSDAAIVAALRQRVDAAFVPRRLVRVDALPRDATGKLTAERLAILAAGHRLVNVSNPTNASDTSNATNASTTSNASDALNALNASNESIASSASSATTTQRAEPRTTPNPGADEAPQQRTRNETQEQPTTTLALDIAADHPSFAGHFPGQPLVPGVVLLAEVLEAVLADATLAGAVGPAPRLATAKFLAPVRPGSALTARFRKTATALHFEVLNGEQIAARGQYDLAAPDDPASERRPG